MKFIIMAVLAVMLQGCSMNSWKSPNTPEVRLATPEPICTDQDKAVIRDRYNGCMILSCTKKNELLQEGEEKFCKYDDDGKLEFVHVTVFNSVAQCLNGKLEVEIIRRKNCNFFIADLLKHQSDK